MAGTAQRQLGSAASPNFLVMAELALVPARIPWWVSAHRFLEKVLQRLVKLWHLVSQPQLGLRNSPPYLPHLVLQTQQHLELIRGHYGPSLAQLWEEGYFRIFLCNLFEKIKQVSRLFKKDKDEIFQEGSTPR